MSRANISVLLATFLLGVLLWVVISIARDWNRAPAEVLPLPADIAEPDPSLPRILTRDALRNWLAGQGYAADSLINDYRNWLTERGFVELPLLLDGEADKTSAAEYAQVDDADLVLLAGQGDSIAALLLGEKSLQTDPLAALDWFDQASVNGSVYAMIRTADLLSTLASPELNRFVSDPVWQAALQKINAGEFPPGERALAWALAAIIVGGYAILDPGHAERILALTAMLDESAVQRSCALAQDYVLTTASARRAKGGMLFSTQPPLLALSATQAAAVAPCDVPIIPLVALDDCTQQEFVGPAQQLMTAWLCTRD